MSFYLRRRVFLLFCLDCVHVDVAEMLVFGEVLIEGVGWVDGLKFFGGIFARIL